MKLPKYVYIEGFKWVIKQDKFGNGGSIDYRGCITIGTKNPSVILDTFLHEVIEAIFWTNHCWYHNKHTNYDNGDIMFVCNHHQFEKIIADLRLALKDVIV